MPNYTWACKDTGEVRELFVKIADRDIPPDEPGNWERVIEMPAHKRTTYLDGQRGKIDKSFNDIKQAARMEVQHAESESKTERAEIRKEIDKLTSLKK